MTKEEFFEFCTANKHLRIERDKENQIFIMAPEGGETGRKHIKIATALEIWNTQTNSGVVFDSAAGFELPDGSTRSPDAGWIRKEKWNNLSAKQRKAFLPFGDQNHFAARAFNTNKKLSIPFRHG